MGPDGSVCCVWLGSMNRVGIPSDLCYREVESGVIGGVQPAERMLVVSKTLNQQMCEMAREVVQ